MTNSEQNLETESVTRAESDTQRDDINQVREELLRPLARRFGYPLGGKILTHGMPTVLCLGNHSSGKSTFINHLIGASVQDTGVAPTDDGFTIITYGEQESVLDGRAVVADPKLPYGNFEQYGKDFLDRLRLKRRPLAPLQGICLIDSPGLIDHAGAANDSSRGYDFAAVVREFAHTADLIVFFYDPDKPGTTGESLRIFTDALSDVMYKLLIVFNKVDTFADVRDFARTYGALCWNLSRIVRTKDMPHIYCTFVGTERSGSQRTIELADFEKSTRELEREIGRVGERRRSNMISALLDTARQLRIHTRMCLAVGRQMLYTRLGVWGLSTLAIALASWLLLSYRDNTLLLWTGGILGGVGLLLLAATPLWSRWRLRSLLGQLDTMFYEQFKSDLLEVQNHRFLEGLWQAVRPRTIHFLKSVGPGGIPFWWSWHRKLKRLQQYIVEDIPNLHSKVDSQ